MSQKHKKMSRALNYFDHFLVFVSDANGCVSISTFASLVGVPVSILSSAAGLKMSATTGAIKKYNSNIKKKRQKHDKIMFWVKSKLDEIIVLISKTLINSYINHDKFLSVSNGLREFNKIKEEIKNLENTVEYTI